jgi:hypothetical protein
LNPEKLYSYPTGVVRELTVEKDDLRYFGGAKQVFWAVTPALAFDVTEIRIIDPVNGPIHVGVRGDGYEQKDLFFCDESPPPPHELSRENVMSVICYGIETDVIGFEGTECHHVQRKVKPSVDSNEKLPMGWTEDMWFARGKGLVRLVQKVEGKTSMTWVLDKVSFNAS